MAVLYVSEYAEVGHFTGGHDQPMAEEVSVAEQSVSESNTSAQSNSFNALTKFVRVHTDAICSIAFGTNPTAVTTAKRLAANQTEYFSVPVNQAYKVAVIANT